MNLLFNRSNPEALTILWEFMVRCQKWQSTRVRAVEGKNKAQKWKSKPSSLQDSHTWVFFMQSEIRSRNTSNLYISLSIPRGYADRRLKHISKLNKLPSSEVRSSSVHLLSLSQSKVKHVGLNLFGLSSSFSHSDSDTAASPNPFYLSLLRALNHLSKQSKGGLI